MRLKNYLIESYNWDEFVKGNSMLKSAVKVLEKITNKGFKAFIVGGSVRDLIIGTDVHDVDIATNCPIDVLEKLFGRTYDIGQSKDFGIIVVKEGGFSFEVANFRQDGKYSDGRKPDTVKISSDFKDDAARRDFTINAMAIDKDGNIIDYFDGQKDIKDKILKTVGNARERFSEDHLRILRAARFSSKLGFALDAETKKAAKELSSNVTKLSPERIKEEIFKAASQTGDKFAKYLIELDDMGVLDLILPEITRLKGMEHLDKHHPEGGVWEHTLSALRQNKLIDPIVNLSILLHDVGKGVSRVYRENGDVMYKGHDAAGLPVVDEIADRLKMSNKERDTFKYVVGNHMKIIKIKEMKPSKIASLVNHEDWEILLATAQADEFSRLHKAIPQKEYDEIIQKAIDIKNKWGIKAGEKALKLVDGNHVMELTGLKAGPKVGAIIKKVTEYLLDNNIDINDTKFINDIILKFYKEIN